MSNKDIYEKAKKSAFDGIKRQRDAHAAGPGENDPVVRTAINSIVFDICGETYRDYRFIIDEANYRTKEMFVEIIKDLLERYNIDFESVDFQRLGIQPVPVFAFIQKTKHSNNMFIIKEFGLNHRIGDEKMKALAKKYNAKYAYVSLVKENAFAEAFNHNENVDDPARGTDIISLPFFLKMMFGEEEKSAFLEFADCYTQEVQDYLGLSVVKSLTPNALFSFKRTADYEAFHFPYFSAYENLDVNQNDIITIAPEQWTLIDRQYREKRYYKMLTGKKDFSQSFMTAEWLFDSMKLAGKIDYSSVAMGYFKSVEQLIWDILVLHKKEEISIKQKGYKHYIYMNDPEITWDENSKVEKIDTTIGALVGAFDYHKNRQVLFRSETDENTQNAIISVLRKFKSCRNGYTHKDNINDWGVIKKIRDISYLSYFLIIGACNFREEDKRNIGIPLEDAVTPYVKLCDYVNYNCNRPYYLYDGQGNITVALGQQDNGLTFNEYGDPTFSGSYFCPLLNAGAEPFVLSVEEFIKKRQSGVSLKGEIFWLRSNELPQKIYCGTMSPVAEGLRFSGPEELIFENGIFIDPGISEKPKY